MDDCSDLVLAMAGELLSFDFHDSFTSAFEVSNKASMAAGCTPWAGRASRTLSYSQVVELLMMRSGIDVCCQSPEDKSALDRLGSGGSAP